MSDYPYDAVMCITKCFAGVYGALFIETLVLLCSAIYDIRLQRAFSRRSATFMVFDLCTAAVAWLMYALHVLLVDGLGTWSEDIAAIQDRIGLSTMGLSLLLGISLVLKLVLLKNRDRGGALPGR